MQIVLLIVAYVSTSFAYELQWNISGFEAPEPTRITKTENLQFIDSFGRQRFFRGMNVVFKGPPYYPPTDQYNPLDSFSIEDVKLLSDLNVNIIRLGVEWAGFEPVRDVYDEVYIQKIKDIVEMCDAHGIYVILDMHQDLLSPRFCGEGVPDWFHENLPPTNFPSPLLPPFSDSDKNGYPSREDCNKTFWFNYYSSQAVGESFQHLYDNTDGLALSFARFWKRVALEFKNNKNIVGYELMNEPFNGDTFKNPEFKNAQTADLKNLEPFYNLIHSEIRSVDESTLVFFDLAIGDSRRYTSGFLQAPGGKKYASRSVISYHHYTAIPAENSNFEYSLSSIEAQLVDARRLKVGMMLTEFEFGVEDADNIEHKLRACDEFAQSWIGWQYKPFYSITNNQKGESMIDSVTGEIRASYVSLWARTYAHAVAGDLISQKFDMATSRFEIVFYAFVGSDVPTEIRMIKRIAYPRGYMIHVLQGDVKEVKVVNDNLIQVFGSNTIYNLVELHIVQK